jgi:hypothetical protein
MTSQQTPSRWQHDGPDVDPWAVLSYLISGVLLYGGIGWAVSVWLGSRAWIGVGIVLGGVLGVLTVYLRYGRDHAGPPAPVGPVVLPGRVQAIQAPGDATTPDLAPPVLPLAAAPAPLQSKTTDEEDMP